MSQTLRYRIRKQADLTKQGSFVYDLIDTEDNNKIVDCVSSRSVCAPKFLRDVQGKLNSWAYFDTSHS